MPEVLPRRGLVKNDHLGIEREDRGDGDTLFLPVAQRGHRPAAERMQPADGQRMLHALLLLRLGYAAGHKPQRHLVEDLHLGDHLVRVLHDIPDVVGALLDGQLHQIPPVEGQRALLLRLEAAEHLGKRGLPRAVAPDDGQHLALAHRDGNAVQRLAPIVVGEAYIPRLQQHRRLRRLRGARRLTEPAAHRRLLVVVEAKRFYIM